MHFYYKRSGNEKNSEQFNCALCGPLHSNVSFSFTCCCFFICSSCFFFFQVYSKNCRKTRLIRPMSVQNQSCFCDLVKTVYFFSARFAELLVGAAESWPQFKLPFQVTPELNSNKLHVGLAHEWSGISIRP